VITELGGNTGARQRVGDLMAIQGYLLVKEKPQKEVYKENEKAQG